MPQRDEKYVIVSRPVADRLQPAFSLYREDPGSPHDTGWRVFTGLEDDEGLEDPESVVTLKVPEILAIEPRLAAWLDHPVGTCLEREEPDEDFVESIDIPLFDTPLQKPISRPR